MSFDFGPMHDAVFDALGEDATITRDAMTAPARIIVQREQEQLGDYGQVVGLVTAVSVRVAEWSALKEGDIVAWTDQLGAHSRRVVKCVKADGYITQGVLHG